MTIDALTGRVTLGGGFSFDDSLSQYVFEAQGLHDPGQVYNPGTPWYYHPFTAGLVEGHPLLLTLCFYRDRLVSLSFIVNLYPPGPKSWDNLSYDTEERFQQMQAALLRQWFGPPHKVETLALPFEGYPALKEALQYNFTWGKGWCSYDQLTGSTSAGIAYTQNDNWAREDYKERRL